MLVKYFRSKLGIQSLSAPSRKLLRTSQEAFRNVDACSLTLWKVSIPVDRHLQQSLANIDLTDETSLSSVDDLFDVFSDVPPRKHLHIVIKPRVGE